MKKLIEDTAKEAAFGVNSARLALKTFTQEELIKFLKKTKNSEGVSCPYPEAIPSFLSKKGLISKFGSRAGVYHFTGDLRIPIHYSVFVERLKHYRTLHAAKPVTTTQVVEVSTRNVPRINLSEFIDTSRYTKAQLEALEIKVAEDIEFLRSLGLKVLKPKPLEYVEL